MYDPYMTKQLEKLIGGQRSAARLGVKQCHKHMPETVCVTKLRLRRIEAILLIMHTVVDDL